MKFFCAILLILSLCPQYTAAEPVQKNIGRVYSNTPKIEKFKKYYGSVQSGFLVFLGTEDIEGLETEIHLYFVNRKLKKVIMILGPRGIGENNCLERYRKIVQVLNRKYGKYSHQHIHSDTLMNDLVTMSRCAPIKNQLYKITNYWSNKNLDIVSELVGDDFGFYVEIEYSESDKRSISKKDLKKIL